MSATKVRVNTEWLSACGGCHTSILDIHEKVIEIFDAVEIQRCPLLTDIKTYPKAEVGLVSGAIRNEHDREAAEKMREACDLIIAFGTCAVYGGIPGAALVHSREEMIDCVYRRSRTTQKGVVPSEKIAPLEKTVTPLDEVIKVDLYLPGCPPHANFTFDALFSLIEKRPPRSTRHSVCGNCRRTMKKTDVKTLKKSPAEATDPDTCFLSQGVICLGSATLDRCLAPCTAHGVPCTGCAGPTTQVCTEPNRDIRTEVAERMSKVTQIDRREILEAMEQSAKTHYAYAMATKMIGEKPTFLIGKWIEQVETAT